MSLNLDISMYAVWSKELCITPFTEFTAFHFEQQTTNLFSFFNKIGLLTSFKHTVWAISHQLTFDSCGSAWGQLTKLLLLLWFFFHGPTDHQLAFTFLSNYNLLFYFHLVLSFAFCCNPSSSASCTQKHMHIWIQTKSNAI